jgi:fatty acid/phospholipid biosynthesis enzyme
MRIGIDIMGGDFAPEATTLGAILAYKELSSDDTIVLIGDKEKIQTILDRENVDASNFEIVHSSEVIERLFLKSKIRVLLLLINCLQVEKSMVLPALEVQEL